MKAKRRTVIITIVLLAIGVLVGGVLYYQYQCPRLYRVTILPSLGGKTMPTAMNDRGQVVGYSQMDDGEFHAFLWDRRHGMEDLGVLKGSLDINNAGWITGAIRDANGCEQAFIRDPNGARQFLGDLGDGKSWAISLNDRCQAVGESEAANGSRHAFFWERATGIRRIVALTGKDNHVRTINNAGLVLGIADMETQPNQRFLWDSNNGVGTVAPPFVQSKVCDLNNRSQFLGLHRNSKQEVHMVLWRQETGIERLFHFEGATDLPAGVNDANQVVYEERLPSRWEWFDRSLSRWVLWDPNRGKIDLNRYLPRRWRESFWVCDINEKGWIVGGAVKGKQGDVATFLLEPIAEKWER